MSKRVFELDFLKAIGILAVILGHMCSPYFKFIFSWHMPLFFFASGFLLMKKYKFEKFSDVIQYTKKSFFSLYKYYVIFFLIGTTVTIIKKACRGETFSLYEYLLGGLYYMDVAHLDSYAMVLWFLPALFIARTITVFYNYWFKNIWAILLMAVITLLIPINLTYLGFGLSTGMVGSFWSLVGGCIASIKKKNILQFPPIFSNVLLVAVSVFLFFTPPPILNIGLWIITDNIIKIIFYSLFVIFILLKIGAECKKCGIHVVNCVEWLSKESIWIMIIHIYTNNITSYTFKYFDYHNWIIEFLINILLAVYVVKCKTYFIKNRWSYL